MSFHFTATLTNRKHISAETYGDMTFTEGVADFYLKDGQSKEATGLPNGAKYTVEEAPEPGFTQRKTNASKTISDNKIECVFTNTRDKGRLTVKKTEVVSDRVADSSQTFYFTVKLGKDNGDGTFTLDKTISKTYNRVTFSQGVATVSLRAGQSQTISGLPQGIDYVVTENPQDNFEELDGVSGTISATESVAEFTNTRKTGDLKISKTVAGGSSDDAFTFTVSLLKNRINKRYDGEMKRANGETETVGVEFASSLFTNSATASVTLKDGEEITIFGLPTDVDYTVTENADANRFYIDSRDNTGAVGGNSISGAIRATLSEVEFTNTFKQKALAVSKSVYRPIDSDNYEEFQFKVTLTGDKIAEFSPADDHGDMTFQSNGEGGYEATVTLKPGERKIATNLRAGIEYAVEEILDYNDNFSLYRARNPQTGTVSENSSEVSFISSGRLSRLSVSSCVRMKFPRAPSASFAEPCLSTQGRPSFNVILL